MMRILDFVRFIACISITGAWYVGSVLAITPPTEEAKQSKPAPVFECLIDNRLMVEEPFLVARPKVIHTFKITHQYETYTVIETEYIGEYFVTAYCPEECGWSWSTSSGATCHYSDDPMVPTTCAIDRNYHSYGELLMIDGKLYVTEDTGPGVKGHWVDCFVETMDEVRSWSTGWKSVYSVEIIEYEVHHARFNIN